MRVFRLIIIIIYLMSLSRVNAANITGSNTINSDSSTQQVYNADETSLTITNSSTFQELDRHQLI